MISIWIALLMVLFTAIVIFAALGCGFYFARLSLPKAEEQSKPSFLQGLKDFLAEQFENMKPHKNEDEEEPKGFYD